LRSALTVVNAVSCSTCEEPATVPDYLPTAPYRGTRDFLPAEMSIRTQVFHRLYEVIERYGYQRYDGPILEPIEMYEAKSSREIVGAAALHAHRPGRPAVGPAAGNDTLGRADQRGQAPVPVR
jgi:Histidyl-tRNA synthetase